ncbi:sensor histidine kinase/response regulator [Venturia nashicola]|uniref:Sensor histidine kinase/response regulator n=1 Tax=Venturia nashicola TaxID=86259 RepID=A0A4Z1NC45_9PEZI|nr:sensor histidine kinase/response regulator [Venturia nashicola]TLD14837.1 sensor histidine kinase/response regulator [Venturia nashicola]
MLTIRALLDEYCPKELRGYDLSSLLEVEPHLPIPPPGYIPRPSPDSALTAFAQLGALRLGAARALISLLDGRNQYILAEATSSLPLRSGRRHDVEKELWLGNVRIPRSAGMCERVLELEATRAIVIDDLAENAAVCDRAYIKDGPKWRFYAGVPINSPDGAVIGALCIFDDKPREGLCTDHLDILHDLAGTVIEHLAAYRLREENRRGERMVRGLTSFLEGASELQHSKDDDESDQEAEMTATSTASKLQKPPLRRTGTGDSIGPISSISEPDHASRQSRFGTTLRPPGKAREQSAKSILQNSILPAKSRSMFSRAANIIRETSELDGVVIFDASIAGVGGQQERSPSPRPKLDDSHRGPVTDIKNEHSSTTGDTSSSDSSSTRGRKDRQQCQILGFSCADTSSVAGDDASTGLQSLTEYDLKKMLKLYSKGKILNFGSSEAMTSSDESTREEGSAEENTIMRQSRKREGTKRLMDVIKRVAPGVRSLCFLPLWDYDRSRWFVGCLFWTTQPDRLLSPTLDLVYLKAFGNSVMTELSRLNAIASNKTKTTFAASISHELRSPLHGILGGIEFLQQSKNLDPFQKSMLHSTSICGKTLLDTLNHVMDYTKINEINDNPKSRTEVIKSNSVRMTSRPARAKQATQIANFSTMFDFSEVTEEVVEAVFASQSYRVSHGGLDDDHISQLKDLEPNTSHVAIGNDASRRLIRIILDMPVMDNWLFAMPIGAWRRILMNLFGNALKYTNSGTILVSLKQVRQEKHHGMSETKVVLTVKDTGIGMSSDFLANRLYTAFSQENYLSSGIGLGLNIVRQILESVSGSIDLTSDVGLGTEVSVTLSLPAPDKTVSNGRETDAGLEHVRRRVTGRKVCLVDKAAETSQSTQYSCFVTTLASTLQDWLMVKPTITHGTSNLVNYDVVICTEPSFEFLASVRKQRPADGGVPVVIFIAIDAIEAAALCTDVRITSTESVVEVVSQPCGPYKLSRLLEHCMNRYESPFENIAPILDPAARPSTSPQPTQEADPLAATVSMPELPIALQDISNLQSLAEGRTQSTHHILIVDDNAINRRLLVALMKRHKYTYREATNGLEAVNIYEGNASPRFDVVLMDLSMPVMDGMTASAKIRKHEKEQKMSPTTIIALTGLVSASAKLEALESGMDHYLTKPVNFGRLVEVLVGERGRATS